MMAAAIDTGSLTDWIQAILAVLGAIAGVVAWWTRRKNQGLIEDKDRLEREKIELETEKAALELDAARLAEFDRISTQAKQIVIVRGAKGYPLVDNKSDGPIHNLTATMFGLNNPANDGKYFVGGGILRAGESRQISLPEFYGEPDAYDVRFQDAAGHWWRRDEYGNLRFGEPARVSGVVHPPRDA